MNNAITEQPLPKEVKYQLSVQEIMYERIGKGIGGKVVEDALLRAKRAKEKYKLEKEGLFVFNGRDALLDLYQELVDGLVYLFQYEIEQANLGNEETLPPFFHIQILSSAMIIRNLLEKQGDFE